MKYHRLMAANVEIISLAILSAISSWQSLMSGANLASAWRGVMWRRYRRNRRRINQKISYQWQYQPIMAAVSAWRRKSLALMSGQPIYS
jgi:hypothetical protein